MEIGASSVVATRDEIDRLGFALVAAVFGPDEVDERRAKVSTVLGALEAGVIRREDAVVGARNLLLFWPEVANIWWRTRLLPLLTGVLGPEAGLVRVLFFDKPPVRTWSLPWHKDLTIAVRDNRRPSREFRNPTVKAGVPHVEASESILQSMLTARIHLDDVTHENGPMTVIPASHLTGKAMDIDEAGARKILGRRGDVLLIRPLVAHNSLCSQPGTCNHRRILHLEFAARNELPDGYEWHDFVPIAG